MGAEIRYLLAASGATINDNREAINDATMMSATSELVQEDPMPTRAGSYLAALLSDAQAPRKQHRHGRVPPASPEMLRCVHRS